MIVVIGDVMCCVYVNGVVNRLSPDAPVPVLLRNNTSRRPSGACLAAFAATRQEQGVAVIGVVGDDEPGRFVHANLQANGVRPLLGVISGCSTITKSRFHTGDHHLLRVDDDSAFADHSNLVEEHFLSAWRNLSSLASVVLFSDYNKASLSKAAIESIIFDARQLKVPVIVDSKRRDMSCFQGANAWTPNTSELEASGQTDNQEGWQRTCDWLGLDALIVTRAERGATVACRDGTFLHIAPPKPERVVSVAGAGDTLAGVLAAGISEGLAWPEATERSVFAATKFVGDEPTVIPLGQAEGDYV